MMCCPGAVSSLRRRASPCPRPLRIGATLVIAGLLLWSAWTGSGDARAAVPAPREVYLVQDSGWMEPFYLDPVSKFRPALRAFIQASALPGARVTIASFNQAGQLPGRASPLPLFSGSLTPAALDIALGKLDLPRRADGKYTDADYNGALSDTITGLLDRKPGVIWMVTNNKNSRSNDQHVVENTSRFSTLLSSSDFISRIVSYPLRMPAHGPTFSENGLVLYGIAYGAEAAGWLQQAVDSPAMRQLLVDRPVRLKPLTQDPLILTLSGGGGAGGGGAGIHLSRSGRAIVIDGLSGGRAAAIDIPARLTSTYYPQVIEQARLEAGWSGGGPAVGVAISPQTITGMGPDGTLDGVHIRMKVPAIPRPPGLSGLLQGERRVGGVLRLRLDDLHLTLQPAFLDKMRGLFGSDAEAVGNGVMRLGSRQSELSSVLPAVFLGQQAVAAATTEVPVILVVAFSPWPLILLVVAAVLAILLLAGLLLASGRERSYSIPVGTETMTVSLRPFRSTTLRSRSGVRVAVTGRLFRTPRVVHLS